MIPPPETPLFALLRASAARHAARPAVAQRGLLRYRRWSYADLLARTEQVAAALAAHGVRPGDRVLTRAPNSPALVAAYFGIWRAGAIVVPLDARTPPAVVARVAARVAPRLLLVDAAPGAAAPLDSAPPDVPVLSLEQIAQAPCRPEGWSPGRACRSGLRAGSILGQTALMDLGAVPTDLLLADEWIEAARPSDDGAAHAALPPGVALAEVAEIVFTSGTTGEPRGVVLTHANLLASVRAGARVLPLRPGDAVLSLLPLSHLLEQTAGLLVPLACGAQVIYPASRQPRALLRALRDNRVVAAVVVPQALELLWRAIEREAAAPRRRGRPRSRLAGEIGSVPTEPALSEHVAPGGWGRAPVWRQAQRVAPRLPWPARRALFASVHAALGWRLTAFLCGGAPLPPALQAAWERLGVRVVQGYGTTECAPGVTSNSLARRVPGSAGQPLLGVALRLSADGEVLVRGPNVTPGYWGDPAATAAALAGGWYHTGDLGALDAAGNLYLRGRSRDLIGLADGQNVYPEDVEAALRADPAIRDCVVLGTPGPDGAPRVHAVLLPAAGADAAAAREAVRRATAALAPHQRPTRVSVWPGADFPRTATLKVRRHLVAAGLAGLDDGGAAGVAPREAASDDVLYALLARLSGRPPETIGPASDLGLDLGLDSLARVELAALLDAELGVAVDDAAVAAAGTVDDLAALLTSPAAGPLAGVDAAPTFPRWARRAPARWARAALLRLLVDGICTPLEVAGREHLRGERGPLLLVANHASHLDTPLLLRALPPALRGRLAVAAAADYFYRRRALGAAVSLLLGAFPLARLGPCRASLEYCGELVDAGWSVLVYPEGSRSPDGRPRAFKGGIGLLAVELGVPVVPVHLAGTTARLPRGARWPRRGPAAVRFGRPLHFAPGMPYADAAAQIEAAVQALGSGSALEAGARDALTTASAGLGGQLEPIHPLDTAEADAARDHQPPGRAVLQR